MEQDEFNRAEEEWLYRRAQAIEKAVQKVKEDFSKEYDALVAERLKTLNPQNIKVGDIIKKKGVGIIKVERITYTPNFNAEDFVAYKGDFCSKSLQPMECKERDKGRIFVSNIMEVPVILRRAEDDETD